MSVNWPPPKGIPWCVMPKARKPSAKIDDMGPVATCWRLGVASLTGELSEAIRAPEHEDTLGDDPTFIESARLCGRDPEVDRLGLTAFAYPRRKRLRFVLGLTAFAGW